MSFNMADAFAMALSLVSRPVQIERLGVFAAESIRISVSNYSRNLQGPEETVIEGREFVIDKRSIDATTNYTAPRRGDLLIDTILGTMTISDVNEMFAVGGVVVGYRVRTS